MPIKGHLKRGLRSSERREQEGCIEKARESWDSSSLYHYDEGTSCSGGDAVKTRSSWVVVHMRMWQFGVQIIDAKSHEEDSDEVQAYRQEIHVSCCYGQISTR